MTDRSAERAAGGGISGEIADERCFVNTFPDFEDLSPDSIRESSERIRACIDTGIHALLDEIRPKVGLSTKASVDEHDVKDFTLYAGVGGLALALWTASRHIARSEACAELAEA